MSENAELIQKLREQIAAEKHTLYQLRVSIRRKERALQALEGEPITTREPAPGTEAKR